MKKSAVLLFLFFALFGCAHASVEEALEASRAANGLLPDVPGGAAYSAEVTVREMRLRLLQNDRERFDGLYELIKKHFQSPLLLLYPQLDGELRPLERKNSTGTDLLLCRILLDAAAQWNDPKYREHAIRLAGRLQRFNVYRDVLINGATWKERRSGIFTLYEPSHQISLHSIDVRALQQLQALGGRWESVAQRCLGILLAAGDAHTGRLVYDLDKRAYIDSPGGRVEELWIVTHLLEGGLAPLPVLERFAALVDADPAAFSKGEHGSLTASILGGYVLGRAGYAAQSHRVFLSLDETFGLGENLLHAPDQPPRLSDNVLYLTVRELLKKTPPRE